TLSLHDALPISGYNSVSCSPKTINVSNKLRVTLKASPSVVVAGSREVESPPRPKTNSFFAPLLSPSLSLSLSPPVSSFPEQAASKRTSTLRNANQRNQFFRFLIVFPLLFLCQCDSASDSSSASSLLSLYRWHAT